MKTESVEEWFDEAEKEVENEVNGGRFLREKKEEKMEEVVDWYRSIDVFGKWCDDRWWSWSWFGINAIQYELKMIIIAQDDYN